MGSDFEETRCVTSEARDYVSIILSDGVREKAINFVSDGIIYWSQIPGGHSAENYEGESRMIYETGDHGPSGMLSIVFQDSAREPNVVGSIRSACWEGLTQLVRRKAETSHIQLEERARRSN